jgi:hypothetical protein
VARRANAAGDPLPASAISWTLIMHHCPSNCHTHTIQTWDGVAGRPFGAPDHEYPSYLELLLTATDGGQSTTTVRLNPSTARLQLKSAPIAGVRLVVDEVARTAPSPVTVIKGHAASVSAPARVWRSGQPYHFLRWSDGGAASQAVTLNGWTARWGGDGQSGETAAIGPLRRVMIPAKPPATCARSLELMYAGARPGEPPESQSREMQHESSSRLG